MKPNPNLPFTSEIDLSSALETKQRLTHKISDTPDEAFVLPLNQVV
jgi:hypothetical protein